MEGSDYSSDTESESEIVEEFVGKKNCRGKVGINTSGKKTRRQNYMGLIRESGNKFYCNWTNCTNSTAYSTKQSLRLHIRTNHWGETYTCEVCDKIFKMQPNYLAHLKTHTCPDSCRCAICQMVFATQRDKDVHDSDSKNHAKNIEDVADEESFYSNHPLPDDPLDLENEETGTDPILDPPITIKGVSTKLIETEGEEDGTYGCVKNPGTRSCHGTYHRLFGGQKRCFKINGRRVTIKGHHSCRSRNTFTVYVIASLGNIITSDSL